MRKRGNKYFNKCVIVDGIEFQSQREAQRYWELCQLEKAGEINNLLIQQPFVLVPTQREPDIPCKRGNGFKQGKVIEKAITYIADFTYTTKDGELIVEDVKGYRKGQAYAVFTIKRKLLLYFYNIRIKEIV